jgi:signal transduction histidine kinase
MFVAKLNEQWRSSAIRFAILSGLLFVAAVVALLGFIYWRTTLYLHAQTKSALDAMMRNFSQLDDAEVIAQIDYSIRHDVRHINLIGLFSADRKAMFGNLRRIPTSLRDDNNYHQFTYDSTLRHLVTDPLGDIDSIDAARDSNPSQSFAAGQPAAEQARGIGFARLKQLKSGKFLVVGRDITQMDEARHSIEDALITGGTCILIIGLAGGFVLSRRPVRRINAIRAVAQKIMLGDLQLRIPYSQHHDELDMLAETVNRMLDEIARLLVEVKSVSDTIAHDLRTPLTRLRGLLYRTLQECKPGSRHYTMFEQAVEETDTLLSRFRALLRIAEIENRERRAGFVMVDLAHIMEQIRELFEPLALEKDVELICILHSAHPVLADPDLLFEALSNLVDNAIKFAPLAGGYVELTLTESSEGPVIDIQDNGPGIAVNERASIMKRFYRSNRDHPISGFGLGLSIVNAIVLLHGFKLELHDVAHGTHFSLRCWPHLIEA